MNDNNKIQIDISLMPEYVKESLAVATLEFIRQINREYPEKLEIYVDALSENNK